MTAYFVAVREAVYDPEQMKLYGELAAKSTAGHELTRLAAYGHLERVDGDPVEGAVIFAFPSFEAAQAWYESPAYQTAVVHRLRGAKYRSFIIQGVD